MDASTMQTGRLLVAANEPGEQKPDDSPEARMNRRFPQKIRVGTLVGYPVIDDDYGALGDVIAVVRTPEQKIKLIVLHGAWFGHFGRKIAVPIEVVAILGQQVASIDMQPAAYQKAPTYLEGNDTKLGNDETIRIALTKR